MKSTYKTQVSIVLMMILITISLLFIGCSDDNKINVSDIDLLRYNEVLSLFDENEELFKESISAIEEVNKEYMALDAIMASEEDLDAEDIELEYISTTEYENIFPGSWEGKTYDELVNEHSKETVDQFYPYKDIEGLYACYFNGGPGYFVEIENDVLESIFADTVVTKIIDGYSEMLYYCYEKDAVTGTEISGIFYSESDAPEPPKGDLAETKETENGWLYQSDYTKEYIEKIQSNFYYYDYVGHDPV